MSTTTTETTTCDLCGEVCDPLLPATKVSRVVPHIEHGKPVPFLCTSQQRIDLCDTCATGSGIASLFDGTARPPAKATE